MNTPTPPADASPMFLERAHDALGQISARIMLVGHAMGTADYAGMLGTYKGASYERMLNEVDMLAESVAALRAALVVPDGNGSNDSNDNPREVA